MTPLWTLVKVFVMTVPCIQAMGCTTPTPPALSATKIEHLSYDTCQTMAQQYNEQEGENTGFDARSAGCVQDGQAEAAVAAYAVKIGAAH